MFQYRNGNMHKDITVIMSNQALHLKSKPQQQQNPTKLQHH